MWGCADVQILLTKGVGCANLRIRRFFAANWEDTYYVSNFDTMAALQKRKINGDWGNLSYTEIESIKAGLKDIKAGRIYSHADVMAKINKKLNRFTRPNSPIISV